MFLGVQMHPHNVFGSLGEYNSDLHQNHSLQKYLLRWKVFWVSFLGCKFLLTFGVWKPTKTNWMDVQKWWALERWLSTSILWPCFGIFGIYLKFMGCKLWVEFLLLRMVNFIHQGNNRNWTFLFGLEDVSLCLFAMYGLWVSYCFLSSFASENWLERFITSALIIF